MQSKAKPVFLLTFLFLSVALMAQNHDDYELNHQEEAATLLLGEPQFGVQLGSSFTNMSGFSPMFSKSVSPFMNYQVNPRLNLSVGASLGSTTAAGFSQGISGSELGFQDGINSTSLYAGGTYDLSPQLSIRGAGWVERGNIPVLDAQMNPQAFDMNAGGMMMGVDFRLTDNVTIGAEINMSQGNNPFHRGIYQGSRRMNSPFFP